MFMNFSNLPGGNLETYWSKFDAVIGDGAINVFQGTAELFFQPVRKVLKRNGHLTMRVYISPEKTEDLERVLSPKEKKGFHAFKWRVAQALATPYVPVKELYRVIKPIYEHPI
jgi:cyclopropane fatty-acyl-phospholipid synthase-like methyltransferase